MSRNIKLRYQYKNFYSEGIASEHPDISGQKEFAKKADEELARRKKARAKKSGPKLPSFVKSVRKEETHIDESHYNPVTKKIQDKPASKEEIESLAAKARTKKKTRKPLGSIRKNSATFTPSSPEQVKSDKKDWDEYWEGSWKNKDQKEEYVSEAKGMSKDEMASILKGHKYSKKQLLDMSKKSTKEGRHGEAAAFYQEFEKEEYIAEEEMTASDKAKEKRLKNKYDKSGMKQSMIDQYGKEKGTQIYFAKIRKMATEECECDNEETKDNEDKKEKIDPREMKTRINLVKNKLRSMGLKMGYEPEGNQLDEFLGTGRVVAGRSQSGVNPAGGSRFTQAGTVQKVLGVTVPGSFRPGVSQSDVQRHNQKSSASTKIKPTSQTTNQLLGRTPGGQQTVGINPDNKPAAPAAKPTYADLGRKMRSDFESRRSATNAAIQSLRQSFDYEDAYDYIIEMLVAADYAEDYEAAEVMFEHISDEFTAAILEEYIEEKARGTRKKTTVHAYDVDETLFGHGKKGKPNVQVHVKDASGKRVKSLSNQEFNTHKLDKGHSYDFSEFQSAKKFRETSSPNKKVIKDIKRKQARGQNVHLITARSKFDNPSEFQGHLKKHGIDVEKSNIHYTGGMRGGDIGKKKVDVANAVAKQSGGKKIHMYDDAAKVHKAFEKEKKEKPTSKKIKTHMVAPDKSGESRVRSYQATKTEEMSAYEYWKQFID